MLIKVYNIDMWREYWYDDKLHLVLIKTDTETKEESYLL